MIRATQARLSCSSAAQSRAVEGEVPPEGGKGSTRGRLARKLAARLEDELSRVRSKGARAIEHRSPNALPVASQQIAADLCKARAVAQRFFLIYLPGRKIKLILCGGPKRGKEPSSERNLKAAVAMHGQFTMFAAAGAKRKKSKLPCSIRQMLILYLL